MPLDRPIPAFYCCYLLRSSVRHSSVYIGSTPNPVRRLRQHNGLAKGGAARTSRDSLRPWAMECIVTGFPSHVAALQFEWAWQNPHVTLHIPPESRIQHATQKKRSGHPKRPRHSVSSLLSNLHLLLKVPSFSRWPLELRFFSEDVYKAWVKWCKSAAEPVSVKIIQDFPSADSTLVDNEKGTSGHKRRKLSDTLDGIAYLDIDYAAHKAHVEKGQGIIEFETEGQCAVCQKDLDHDGGLYAICPSPGCESVTHLTCLSKHFLRGETDQQSLLPQRGTCPSCNAELQWVDVVKELTLRMRGQKEVEKLLKVKRVRKLTGATAAQADAELSLDDDDDEAHDADEDVVAEMEEELMRLRQLETPPLTKPQSGDTWHIIEDSEASDTGSITSHTSPPKPTAAPAKTAKAKAKAKASKPKQASSPSKTSKTSKAPRAATKKKKKGIDLATVIADSDWEDAIEV